MEIGGLNVQIEVDGGIRLDDIDPLYGPFFPQEDVSPENIDIGISITLDPIPPFENLERIFDSDQSWSMFRDGKEYYVAMHPPIMESPLWLVRTDRAFTKATIFCSERLVTKKNGKFRLSNPLTYPLDQILLMNNLAHQKGALIHAAGAAFPGGGIIFPGKSGAGKSSLSKQLATGKGFELLSDDRVIVRAMNGSFKAFGTPWPGEAGISVNKSIPLKGVLFLCHGSQNRIEIISRKEALERLIPTVSIPWYDKECMTNLLDLCETLISRVTVGVLHFKPDIEAICVWERFMTK